MSPSADRQTAPATSAYPHIVRVLDTRCFLDTHPSNRSLYERFCPQREEQAAYWSNRAITKPPMEPRPKVCLRANATMEGILKLARYVMSKHSC